MSIFRGVTHGSHTHETMSFEELCATEDHVGGEGGVRILVFWLYTLAADGFTGEGAFVNLHQSGFQQKSVGWDFIARGQKDEVSDDEVSTGYKGFVVLADDTDKI